jgi:hypothetical protein
MNTAFGDTRTLSATKTAKKIMKELESKGYFEEQRYCWMLGAALGIKNRKEYEGEKRETFQNINSLDPEEIFAAVMLGFYPNETPEFRVKKLVDYAEWGLRELDRRYKIGTLDFSNLGLNE